MGKKVPDMGIMRLRRHTNKRNNEMIGFLGRLKITISESKNKPEITIQDNVDGYSDLFFENYFGHVEKCQMTPKEILLAIMPWEDLLNIKDLRM